MLVVLSDGATTVDASDDAVHSNANVTVEGGTTTIATGDDGLHAEADLRVTAGTVTVTKSYEGIEGCKVYISGGNISVTATDDAINASDPAATSDMANSPNALHQHQRRHHDGVSGGTDGLDSNGSMSISGGNVIANGSPTRGGGEGALDANGTFTITGGTVLRLRHHRGHRPDPQRRPGPGLGHVRRQPAGRHDRAPGHHVGHPDRVLPVHQALPDRGLLVRPDHPGHDLRGLHRRHGLRHRGRRRPLHRRHPVGQPGQHGDRGRRHQHHAAQQPAAEQHPAEQPAAEQPAAEQPAAQSPPPAPAGGTACRIADTVNAWNTGLTSSITITNTGSAAVTSWSLGFTLPAGQTITSGWNATYTPTSGAVRATNVSYNGAIPAGGSVSIGFQATHTGNAAIPTAFTLNGTACSIALSRFAGAPS